MSYTAQIRIKRDGVQVYQESQTFARKQAAQAWARKRGSELDEPGAIERANRKGATLKEMTDRYLVEVEKAKPLGKTKRATLNAIGETYLGKLTDTDINTQCLVDYALWRMSGEGGGVQPQTAGNDLAHLGAVLAIAKELQRQINGMKGFRAELTRTGDYFIPLRGRTEIARKKGADLFVSIHADAAPSKAAFGASVFALSERGATSETARWLADSENRSDLIGGAGNVSLDDKDRMLAGVLLDLSMTASLTSSLNVGQKVLSNIGRVTPLHKQRVEQAGFMVLKSPDIPSILVETGFISNSNEASKLASSSHQQALARSISSGVRQFFQQNPPPGTYIAWLRDTGKIAQGAREHTVRPGETLAMIAVRYQVGVATLRSSNSLKTDELKVGQNLNIPATALAAQ